MPVARNLRAAAVLCLVAFAAGCASSGSASKSPAEAKAPRCTAATLGLEAVPVSKELRKKLALPDHFQGAIVGEVLPGGPAAAAGLRVGDAVEEIGAVRIANDCDFIGAAYNRSCDPVRVVVRRAGAPVEVQVVPVDQESYFGKSCREGVASACYRQAWLLWGRNRGADRQASTDLAHAACRSGSSDACAFEGLRLMETPNRGSDVIVALERSCLLNNGSGCAHLGFLHATGKFVLKDDVRATARYVKACELGDPLGCYNVGLMSEEGRGVPKNLARAVARYDEACQMGSSTACTNLGFLYERGQGVKQDKARALAMYQKGCDGGSCQTSNLAGCVNVGRAYRDGIGAAKDAGRAAASFQKACDRNPSPDDLHADENRARACSLLGGLYLAGDGLEKDVTKGRELSERGCERGDSFGCFNAAVIFTNGWGVSADASKAASFLDAACKAGDAEGCHDLAAAYEKGTGVTRDRQRAAELYRKACELGFQKACGKKVR